MSYLNIFTLSINEKITLAKSEQATPEQLMALSYDDSSIEYIAQNKNCPINLLRRLYNNGNWNIKSYIVSNVNCPEDILRKAAKLFSFSIKSQVAQNSNCPLEILEKLSEDRDLIFFILCNKTIPSTLLQKIYKKFPDKVITHFNCPDYLKALSK